MNSPSIQPYTDHRQIVMPELEPDETLLWVQKPNPTRSWIPSLAIWLFAIPWTAFSVFWMWGAAGFGSRPIAGGENLFPLFGLPFVLIGFGMLSAPYWVYRSAIDTWYAITNRRIIIMVVGKTRKVKSYYSKDIGTLERRERPDGSGDLTFAKKVTRDSDGDRQSTDVSFIGIPGRPLNRAAGA